MEAGFDGMVCKVQSVGQIIHADEMRGDAEFRQHLAQE
jgi:hypothetical protein